MQPEYQRTDVYSWVQCGLSLIITPVSVENWFISRSYNIKIGLFPEATTIIYHILKKGFCIIFAKQELEKHTTFQVRYFNLQSNLY